MCNEKNKTEPELTHQPDKDFRFMEYRLNQLELNLRKGQEKLEQEYKDSNKQIIDTLALIQENNNELNKNLIELAQRQSNTENKLNNIDKLLETTTINTTQITELKRRLEIYKQILFMVGGTAVTAFLMALFELVMK